MSITYEWDFELIETATGEVIDHIHAEPGCLKAAQKHDAEAGEHNELVLVRDDDSGRSWAYVKGGKLPSYFSIPESDGNYYETATKVPNRFHFELERYNRKDAA